MYNFNYPYTHKDILAIPVNSVFTFDGRAVTKAKLLQVLKFSRYIQKVKYNRETYYAGQGFFAKGENPFDNIIFIHSVNRFLKREEVTGEDISMYVNKTFSGSAEYKKEQVVIKEFVNECKGTIVYTPDPLQKFEQRFIFRSKSIQGIKRELISMVAPVLSEIRSDTVEEIVQGTPSNMELAVNTESLIPVIYLEDSVIV